MQRADVRTLGTLKAFFDDQAAHFTREANDGTKAERLAMEQAAIAWETAAAMLDHVAHDLDVRLHSTVCADRGVDTPARPCTIWREAVAREVAL